MTMFQVNTDYHDMAIWCQLSLCCDKARLKRSLRI